MNFNFENHFTEDHLKKVYYDKIIHRASVGMDRVIPAVFHKELEKNIALISRKVLSGSYSFTHYKELLISKGRDRAPRVISIPTIRDKLTLATLHKYLQESFHDEIEEPLLHSVISEVKKGIETKKYDSYVKVDVRRFYASINHEILMSKLKKKITDERALSLLKNAISTATVPNDSVLAKNLHNEKGVPEGLSISNILANIYLSDLKKIMLNKYPIAYFRYVDDILILCKESDAFSIQADIIKYIKSTYKLDVNTEKTKHGKLSEGVIFLGYEFFDNRIGVRSSAVQKLETSIELLFRLYSRKVIGKELFLWRLNLKISGCIFEAEKYGWLFFYSQLTDLKVLYHLDWYISKQFDRFKIQPGLKVKRFVRTYYEIINNVSQSTYLINTDHYDTEKKKSIIAAVLPNKIVPEDPNEIDERFNILMFREIQKLEHDIQHFS